MEGELRVEDCLSGYREGPALAAYIEMLSEETFIPGNQQVMGSSYARRVRIRGSERV